MASLESHVDECGTETTNSTAIVANGSSTIRVGFGGDITPSFRVPNVLGRAIKNSWGSSLGNFVHKSDMIDDMFVGNDVSIYENRINNIINPIERGTVRDWDAIESMWKFIFSNKLKIDICNPGNDLHVLMTEPPLNPKKNRENTTALMFETFNVPSFFMASQCVLAMYSAGKTTGMAIDCGATVCFTVPIYEGYAFPHAMQRLPFGGNDIAKYLSNHCNDLQKMNQNDCIKIGKEIIKSEKKISTALDASKIDQNDDNIKQVFKLPDGQSITMGKERIECCEVLFNPNFCKNENGQSEKGISELISQSINLIDKDLHSDLYENVVCCGGVCMIDGFTKRLAKEIIDIAPSNQHVRTLASQQGVDKYDMAWNGASILTQLSTFEQMWIGKNEYDEYGPDIVNRKCT